MTTEDAVAAMIDVLNAAGVPHMLVGSLASNYYGIPRSTQDADFVVQLGDARIQELAQRLGPSFVLDPQMSFETATGTLRHVIQVKELAFLIELFHLSEDAHDQLRFRQRQVVSILGRSTFVPTVADLIITKLRWSLHGRRAKDIEDVCNVIMVRGSSVDWVYVESWCNQHGTQDLLAQVRPLTP